MHWNTMRLTSKLCPYCGISVKKGETAEKTMLLESDTSLGIEMFLIATCATAATPTAAPESEEKLLRCHTRWCIDFSIAAQSVYGDFRATI